MNSPVKKKSSIYRILLLILAGEGIFILPFVLARIFRPTFLDVFNLTNVELGTCFSVYGIVALLSYLYGGAIADKYSPRVLISSALWMTALGGLFLASYPSLTALHVLFGYWGFTTIFLFWGALIKATRTWGGTLHQGRAFGYLEGGRGFVAASIGAIGVYIFSIFLPDDLALAQIDQRQDAFRNVILFSSFIIALIGLLILLFLKSDEDDKQPYRSIHPLSNIRIIIKNPAIWLLMIIVLCAYVGYKLTDIFSLYASEVMLLDQIQSAQIGTFQLYLRPIISVVIGLLADRSRGSSWMVIGFFMMFLGSLLFASGIVTSGLYWIFFLSLIITATGTYAVRTLYFAVLHEGQIPLTITGTAVGVISVVGYTPDIFVGPIMGYLLDRSAGITGHQHVFIMLALFAVVGLVVAIMFSRMSYRSVQS